MIKHIVGSKNHKLSVIINVSLLALNQLATIFKLDSNCTFRSSAFLALHIREVSSAYITVLHVTTSGRQFS